MKPNKPSFIFPLSVIVAMVSLYFSTLSPLVLMLVPLYVSAFLFRGRIARDSGAIWGARLFLYALCAVVGRAPASSFFYLNNQAYVTMGLVLGAEIILQTFRQPPQGFKFDPLSLLVSGLLFAVGFSVSYSPALWISAPLWMFLTLFAMGDVREDAPRIGILARVKQLGLVLIAVCAGFLGHSALTSNRGALTALSARLLSNSNVHVSEAGVADAPQMSSGFNANASTSRLLRISGSLGDSHLRAAAFPDYSNGNWGPAMSARQIVPALPDQTREQKSALTGNFKDNAIRTDWNARITVLRDANKLVFAPLNSAALVPLPAQGSDSFNWHRFDGPLEVDGETPLSYALVDSKTDTQGVQTDQGPLCVSLDPNSLDVKDKRYIEHPELLEQDRQYLQEQRDRLLVVPDEIDPQVKELALTITKGAGTQQAKIDAIGKYLLSNYKYSMNFQRGNQDPVSDFLLHKKSAHCQYFAASAVMLMRCVGIPSRYVSGFWAHENAPDGSTVVRGRDAHAWAEAFVDGTGWVTVETTPPDGRADPKVNPLTTWQKWQERIEDTWTRIRNWFGHLSALQILGMMLVMLALWSLERWRQARKKAHALPAKPVPPLELQPLARGFERALQKRGITLVDGKTWSEILPNEWQTEREWVELYNVARFDQRDETRLRVLTDKLRELEKAKRN